MIPELSNFLKYGLIGLGGIVAILAFYLITQEQKKKESHRSSSNLIYAFMIFGIIICVIGLFAPNKSENPITQYHPDNNEESPIAHPFTGHKPIKVDTSVDLPKPNVEKCTVRTGLLTFLLNEPLLYNSSKLMELPRHKTFEVLDSKIYDHGGLTQVHFFKIKYDNIEGWVNENHLDMISPKCLE